MNLAQRPVYICLYKDGTMRTGSYLETLEWFNKAQGTDNPCSVAPHDFSPYKAP
jgi:hypothetical protein